MKALSVQQPWASLIACGLKDVENRGWGLKSVPVRVLIHAGARRQPYTDANMPYPWHWHIENYQKMGVLPALERTPVSAVVGVATIESCVVGSPSIWAGHGEGEQNWIVKDARMFKEPVLGVKGKLGLFDIPGLEDGALPEFAEAREPSRQGKTLRLQLGEALLDRILDGEIGALDWNVLDSNLAAFADGDLKALPTDKVVAVCGSEEVELAVARYAVEPVLEKRGRVFCAYDGMGGAYEWWKAVIEFE